MILNLLNLHAQCLKRHIKMPKNMHLCVYFLKHDILTLKIRFIEPLHDKTSELHFAYSEDSDQPEHPSTLIRVFTVRTKNATKKSFTTH